MNLSVSSLNEASYCVVRGRRSRSPSRGPSRSRLPDRGAELAVEFGVSTIQFGKTLWNIREDSRADRFGYDTVPIKGVIENRLDGFAIFFQSFRHDRPKRAV